MVHFVSGILAITVGLISAIVPETIIKVIVILFGVASVIKGSYELLSLRLLSEDSDFRKAVITSGALSVAVGLFAIFLPLALFSTVQTIFRIMLYILAVDLLLSACACIFMIIRLNELGIPSKKIKIEAISFVLLAIFLFFLPANFGVTLVRILGVLLVIGGVCYSIYSWRNRVLVIEPESVVDAEPSPRADVE